MTKYDHDTVVPYQQSDRSKKQQVAEMFDHISGKYDFVNRFLSAGTDIGWRKKALHKLKTLSPKTMLDVATGTADMALLAHQMLHPEKVIGIDISDGMLAIGRQKVQKAGLQAHIELLNGDSETINFPSDSFDAVTVAFGVRNFENLERGLAEILRVLKPGGKLVVLEFSKPGVPGIKWFYNLYMRVVAPGVGKMVSNNREAYSYLNNSINKFPEGKNFTRILSLVGFKNTTCNPLSLGICSIYCGEK